MKNTKSLYLEGSAYEIGKNQEDFFNIKKDEPYETIFNFSYYTENKDDIFFKIYVNNEKLKLNYNLKEVI